LLRNRVLPWNRILSRSAFGQPAALHRPASRFHSAGVARNPKGAT